MEQNGQYGPTWRATGHFYCTVKKNNISLGAASASWPYIISTSRPTPTSSELMRVPVGGSRFSASSLFSALHRWSSLLPWWYGGVTSCFLQCSQSTTLGCSRWSLTWWLTCRSLPAAVGEVALIFSGTSGNVASGALSVVLVVQVTSWPWGTWSSARLPPSFRWCWQGDESEWISKHLYTWWANKTQKLLNQH